MIRPPPNSSNCVSFPDYLTKMRSRLCGYPAVLRILAATAVMGGVVLLLRDRPLVTQVVAGALAYPIAALALGAVRVDDVREIGDRVLKRSSVSS